MVSQGSNFWRESEEPRRLNLLRDVMKRRQLSAVIIIGGVNLSYYSGFAGSEKSMARAMIYVCPLEGDPIIIAHTFRQHLVEKHSWVNRFHYFTRLSKAPVEALHRSLDELGLRKGRIGFELGYESQIQMPYAEFDTLRESLHAFEIVDIARDLWRIRSVRSTAELDRQRQAGELVAEVFADSFRHIRAGMRQGELSRFIQQRMLDLGASDHYAIISAGPDNYHFCGAWAPDYAFGAGDMVWMDIGIKSRGYCAAFSRAGVIGGASPEQVATHREVVAATRAGVEAVKVGTPIADIAAICEQHLSQIDAPVTTNIAELGTRYGHGMGIEFIEPPHVAEYDDATLEPGMVIAIEPGLTTRYGRFHFRELVVATDVGFEIIEGPPQELVTIAA